MTDEGAVVPPWNRVPGAAMIDEAEPGDVRSTAAGSESMIMASYRPAEQAPRPRIIDEPGILGLSRRSRSRFGSRLFTLFFVGVFALIVIQMFAELLGG